MTVTAQLIPILNDNYAWLLKDSATGATAIVDPAEAGPIIAAIDAAGGRLDMILLTHHHGDHVADTDVIRARYKCPVVGAAADAHRLPKLDQAVREGDTVTLGSASARVIETPGHTRGQINFFFADGAVLLCGRYAVQPGLRAVAGGHGGGDVPFAARNRRTARCHVGLLRP